MQFAAILWREWIFFKSKWISISLTALAGPVLYLIAFGWGLGSAISVEGMSYMRYVIPGLIAMNSMTVGFSVIAIDINMARSYQKTFEAVMISPIQMPVYTFARISANVLRGLYSSSLIILAAYCFKAMPSINGYFILILCLNSYIFSTLGFLAGLLIDSHADIAKVSSLVITPMSFLCGTFFPLDKFPPGLRGFFEFLPLTQTVKALRFGFSGLCLPILLGWFFALFGSAIYFCHKAE